MVAGVKDPGERWVLLVDDDPEMLAAVRRCLRPCGYRIEAFTDPREALERIEVAPLDLIISDVDMPEMTGHELMAVVRQKRPSAVRLLLTGAPTKDSAVRAINEGEVHRFLEKPFDARELRRLVAEALTRKDELAIASRAGLRASRRQALMVALEQEHPGITDVRRDGSGAYELDGARARKALALLGTIA